MGLALNGLEIPALYETDHLPVDQPRVAYAKFFTPDAQWTWFVFEWDGEDTCFGRVDGLCSELGYFSLKELSSLKGPFGCPVERDAHWKPQPIPITP